MSGNCRKSGHEQPEGGARSEKRNSDRPKRNHQRSPHAPLVDAHAPSVGIGQPSRMPGPAPRATPRVVGSGPGAPQERGSEGQEEGGCQEGPEPGPGVRHSGGGDGEGGGGGGGGGRGEGGGGVVVGLAVGAQQPRVGGVPDRPVGGRPRHRAARGQPSGGGSIVRPPVPKVNQPLCDGT